MKLIKPLFTISLVFLFSASICFSQNTNSTVEKDTLKSKQNISEYKLKLSNHHSSTSPLLTMKQELFFEDNSTFIFPKFEENRIEVPITMMQLRREMNQTMEIYRQGTIKNDLGFVGEILGYTTAAAAVGLAAYHVYKYRDKYGIK